MRFSGMSLSCLQGLVIAVTTQGDGGRPMSIIVFMIFIAALTCCGLLWIYKKYDNNEITFPAMLMEGLEVVVAVNVTAQLFTDGLLVYNWTLGGSYMTALVFMKISCIIVASVIFYYIPVNLEKYYSSKIMMLPGLALKCVEVLLNVAVTTQLGMEVILLLLYHDRPTQHFMGLIFIKIVLIFMIAFMSYSIFLIQRKYYILKTQTDDIQVSSCSLSMAVVFIGFMGALMNDFSSSI